jgi:hypothetical protein
MTSQLSSMNVSPTATVESQVSVVEKADSCRLVAARVVAIKERLLERYRQEGQPVGLVREAIAGAEAKAWLTGYPHLFLPDLAEEILRQLREKGASSHPLYAQAA